MIFQLTYLLKNNYSWQSVMDATMNARLSCEEKQKKKLIKDSTVNLQISQSRNESKQTHGRMANVVAHHKKTPYTLKIFQLKYLKYQCALDVSIIACNFQVLGFFFVYFQFFPPKNQTKSRKKMDVFSTQFVPLH